MGKAEGIAYDVSLFFYNLKKKIFRLDKRKPKTLKSLAFQRGRFIFLMLLIPISQFLLFWVYVNFNSIIMAFEVFDGTTYHFTLENFSRFWRELNIEDSTLKVAIKNSLLLCGTSLFIILPLSLIFSYFLFRKVTFYKGFRVVFFLPSIISSIVLVEIFKYIIEPNGPLVALLAKTFYNGDKSAIPNWLGDQRYSFNVILLYCIWTGFATNIVLLNGAITRIPKEIIEYGRLEGISMFREFTQVVVPMVFPTITTLIITTVASLFTAMGPILPFTNGNFETTTIGFFIFNQVQENSYEYPSAIGLIFTLIGLPLVLIIKKMLDKASWNSEY